MDYENFIRERITELRLKKGVSEYKMSIDLGHSKNYIQGISSKRSLPSVTELIYICKYFGITPIEFFDNGVKNPYLIETALQGMRKLSDNDLIHLVYLINRLAENK